MTVLIVDDSSVMFMVLDRALRQSGLEISEVLGASNGLEGLRLLRSRTPEQAAVRLILCDINMPVMDGLEFLDQMRVEHLAEGAPVVMITTEGTAGHVRRALAAGAAAYIHKPFSAEQVKSCLLSLLPTA